MGNSYYEINCIDEELEIFTVLKRSSGTVYYVTKCDDGSWIHTCKAREVRGDSYKCRHITMVIQKYYVNKKYKHLFNLTKKRTP